MKLFISALLALIASPALAQDVTLARAAELGCHRIERLRDLGRIHESYVNKFQSLRIEENSSGGGKFKFTAFQAPGTNGSAHQIELNLAADGKVVGAHKEITGTDGTSPLWPDKDPVTLTENGLHFVLENGPINAEIAPFFNALTEAFITQVQESGQTLARVQFKNSQSAKVLEVTLKTDGTVVSNVVR